MRLLSVQSRVETETARPDQIDSRGFFSDGSSALAFVLRVLPIPFLLFVAILPPLALAMRRL